MGRARRRGGLAWLGTGPGRTTLLLALLASGCSLAGIGGGTAMRPAPGRILDTRSGRLLAEGELLDRLAADRFVLLGERHDQPEHHRLQARVVRELVARGRRPAVVFEMLSVDVAPALAKALAAPHPTPDSLRRAVHWDESGWPDFAIYAPVFEAALAAHLPIRAADLSASALAALRKGGIAALAPATREELDLEPPLPEAGRSALAEAVRIGHCGYLPEADVPRLVDVQTARDAELARSLAEAARSADGAVLVAGEGHVRRDWAVPFWLRRREPEARIASLAFVEVEPGQGRPGPEAERFDYVWYTTRLDTGDPCEVFRKQLETLRHEAP